MATEIALARTFEERPRVVMQVWEPEAYVIASTIEDEGMNLPLLERLMQAHVGPAEEVVYAPDHLKALKQEVEQFLERASKPRKPELQGSVKEFLGRLLEVVDEGIVNTEGLFAITD